MIDKWDQKGFVAALVLLVIAAALVGGGVWYYEAHRGIPSSVPNTPLSQIPSSSIPIQTASNQQANSSSTITNPALASSETPTSTWKTYTHIANKNLPYDMNISFRYPSDYVVTAPKVLTATDSFPFFNIASPTSTGQLQQSMQLFAWSDPPTHVYENAINGGFAKYFTTSGGLTGVESDPGYILFDTGKKDNNGNKIILSIQGATATGTITLTEKIIKTLVFNQVIAPATQSSQPSVNFTINGSQGPLLVGEGEDLNVVWTSSDVSNCLFDGNSVLDASHQMWGAPPPGVPASSTTYTLTCNAPNGSAISKSIQVSWAPLGFSVAIDPTMPNPESVSPNAQKVLLGSFDATASGPDGIIMTTINIGASADVTSSLLSVSNVKIFISTVGTSTWFTSPPLIINRPESGPNAVNFFYGSLAIPQDGVAHIQIYGNIVAATPGNYLSPFELANITAAGASTPNVYSASSKVNLAGQNMTVTQ